MIWLAALPIILGGLIYWFMFSPTSEAFGTFISHGTSDDKLIALSFDDGPNQPYTEQIGDILRNHNVNATFFQVGSNIEKYPEVSKKLASDGNIIGNHLYSHQFRKYLRPASFKSELEHTQKIIEQTIGETPALYRPPWLFRTPSYLRVVTKYKLTPISGSFGNNWEIFQPSAAKIAQTAAKLAKPGAILIFHDGYNGKGGDRSQTAAAIDLLIPQLKHAGYTFVTVDKLVQLPAYQSPAKA